MPILRATALPVIAALQADHCVLRACRLRMASVSPCAQAFARCAMTPRSPSMRVNVRSKQAVSSRVSRWNSLSSAFGFWILMTSLGSVVFTSLRRAILVTVSSTIESWRRPERVIALLYNSSAANRGRHSSMPASPPM